MASGATSRREQSYRNERGGAIGAGCDWRAVAGRPRSMDCLSRAEVTRWRLSISPESATR